MYLILFGHAVQWLRLWLVAWCLMNLNMTVIAEWTLTTEKLIIYPLSLTCPTKQYRAIQPYSSLPPPMHCTRTLPACAMVWLYHSLIVSSACTPTLIVAVLQSTNSGEELRMTSTSWVTELWVALQSTRRGSEWRLTSTDWMTELVVVLQSSVSANKLAGTRRIARLARDS